MDMNYAPQTPGNAPEQNQTTDSVKSPSSMSTLSTIGILIVILVLGILAFYFWDNKTANAPENVLEQDATTALLQTQGDTDDTASIEADLGATVLDSLDADLGQVDLELQ